MDLAPQADHDEGGSQFGAELDLQAAKLRLGRP
jgi:hypothetical protein